MTFVLRVVFAGSHSGSQCRGSGNDNLEDILPLEKAVHHLARCDSKGQATSSHVRISKVYGVIACRIHYEAILSIHKPYNLYL